MLHNAYLCDILVRDHAETLRREAERDHAVRIATAPQAYAALTGSATPAAPATYLKRGTSCTSGSIAGGRIGIRDAQAPRRVGRSQVAAGR